MKHELSVHSDVNQHSHGLDSNEPLAIPGRQHRVHGKGNSEGEKMKSCRGSSL